MPSRSHRNLTHLGMDVHKDSISVAILRPAEEASDVERIFNDEASVRRLLARFPDRLRLLVCYEAGPAGYELQRLVASTGMRCQVIAPSLIPKSPRHFEDAALAATFSHYRAVVEDRASTLDAIEAHLVPCFGRPPFADAVARLSAYRGVAGWER